ncbi:MAG TPA: hypothetical protein VIJ75_04740 [Hanamia sp.]
MILALALVTVSFVLISIWGYRYYFQNKNGGPASQIIKEPVVSKKTQQDSLKNLKDSNILNISLQKTNIDTVSDSADKTLELKILEYNQLKEEIAEILKNKAALKNRMEEMKKIGEIQKNIDSLKERKEAIIKENERMDELLNQKQRKQVVNKIEIEKSSKSPPASDLPLLVSHLKFEAIKVTEDYNAPTIIALQASKFEGSFEININSKKDISSDIFVKIVQPNGRPVLNASSGFVVLEAGQERRSYTKLLHFDKTKDDHQRLSFSIKPKEFFKGKYTMQIYHDGVMIGRTTRGLN